MDSGRGLGVAGVGLCQSLSIPLNGFEPGAGGVGGGGGWFALSIPLNGFLKRGECRLMPIHALSIPLNGFQALRPGLLYVESSR